MAMTEYTSYNVTVRRRDTGDEMTLLSIASGPARAGEHAIEQARRRIKVMADREYAQFDAVACAAVSRSAP